jgi:hypothetical protein
MKFGRLLQDFNAENRNAKRSRRDGQEETATFLDYKSMKKILKKASDAKEAGDQVLVKQLEKQFVDQLHDDLDQINSSFIEQEEEAVIKMQTLRDEHDAECSKRGSRPAVDDVTWLATPAVRSILSRFVDLHGELVLLLHWSIMNYAGTLKILKKHDKLLGGHSQQDLIGTILSMPFTSTASVAGLASDAEKYVKMLGGEAEAGPVSTQAAATTDKGTSETGNILDRTDSLRALMDETEEWAKEKVSGNPTLLSKTRAALAMLNELQASAHTPSTLNHVNIAKEIENAAVQAKSISA